MEDADGVNIAQIADELQRSKDVDGVDNLGTSTGTADKPQNTQTERMRYR